MAETATAYLDVSGNVLGVAQELIGHSTATLAEFQAQVPSATERIAGAPLRLIYLGRSDKTSYHRKTQGDGTQIEDYESVAVTLPVEATTELAAATVATLPSSTPAGRLIYVSDEAGGSVVAFSDGTNWRRVTDRAIVS